MRTTITLDADTHKAIEQLRRERELGLSEAVNELIRAGLRQKKPTVRRFVQRTRSLGLRVDVTNVVDALEELDGPTGR